MKNQLQSRRLEPKERKARIMTAAMYVTEVYGLNALTREAVAKQANIAPSLVNQYFNDMPTLRNAVMRRAVKYEILTIILDGIVARNLIALKASDEVKARAAALLTAK